MTTAVAARGRLLSRVFVILRGSRRSARTRKPRNAWVNPNDKEVNNRANNPISAIFKGVHPPTPTTSSINQNPSKEVPSVISATAHRLRRTFTRKASSEAADSASSTIFSFLSFPFITQVQGAPSFVLAGQPQRTRCRRIGVSACRRACNHAEWLNEAAERPSGMGNFIL